MNRMILLTVLASAAFGPELCWGKEPASVGRAPALDLQSLRPREARVDPLPGAPARSESCSNPPSGPA